MTKTKTRILLATLLASLWCALPAHAEGFAEFVVRYLSYPSLQGAKASQQLIINGKKAGKEGNYIKLNNTNSIALLCADSASTPVPAHAYLNLYTLNLLTRAGSSYTFAQNGNSYALKEGHTLKEIVDYDFLTFLNEYSHNHDFQIKRTIFPFPQRYFKNGTEGDSKLLMPREWDFLNFVGISPQICLYDNNIAEANNRRLYIYENGKLGKIYNFISINRKWFLIEVENY